MTEQGAGRGGPGARPGGGQGEQAEQAERAGQTSGASAGALVPGEVVGRYVVERPIGAGGMGVVSLARDPELHRAVVIKLVHPAMGSGEGGDELEARLRREAQAMAQVSHTNVVQIFDIGRRGDRVFLAMEFVAGQTLGEWLRERPRTGEEILGVLRQAGAGLAAAHRVGLVHRDFKPSNVLVGHDGVVKVTDFGLARSFLAAGGAAAATRKLRAASGDAATQAHPGPRAAEASPHARGAGSPGGSLAHATTEALRAGVADPMAHPMTDPAFEPRLSGVHAPLTQAHDVIGTPGYMAPEQAAGERTDARTDQYALAITLLDGLLGQSASRRAVAPEDAPPVIDAALTRAGVAPAVRAAILRALSQAPAARFPTIDGFLAALAPLPPAPPRRPRRTPILAAGIALCGAAIGVGLALRPTAKPDCAPAAPAQWIGAPRARVVAGLSSALRSFARWDAERVAAAIDASVAQLAGVERARCAGTEAKDREASAECVARRTAALTAAVVALSASPPATDPWALVASVGSCDGVARYQQLAELRGRLRGASDADARAIARTAGPLGDALLVADAQEATGLAALAAGDAAKAEQDLRAMRETGERADLDEVRGRALVHLIELARWRGDHVAAREALEPLHAIVARHGDGPRDVLTVALVEAGAATELGDVAIAFAAWERARQTAVRIGDHDAVLGAAIGQAWATYTLRLDLEAARAAATTAILELGSAASAAARAAARATAADLALEAGDGAAVVALMAEVAQLDPTRAPTRDPSRAAVRPPREVIRGVVAGPALPGLDTLDLMRTLRGRALTGEVDDALAALPVAGDPAAQARIALVRGQILLAAGRAAEAVAVLDKLRRTTQGARPVAMAHAARVELELTACEAGLASAGRCQIGAGIDALLEPLHPRAPIRAHFARAAGSAPDEYKLTRSRHLLTVLDLLIEAGAAPVQLAELRWQIAQLRAGAVDHRGLAAAARAAFLAAGRSDAVAAIDAWLGEASAAPTPTDTPPPRREPWGPQP